MKLFLQSLLPYIRMYYDNCKQRISQERKTKSFKILFGDWVCFLDHSCDAKKVFLFIFSVCFICKNGGVLKPYSLFSYCCSRFI